MNDVELYKLVALSDFAREVVGTVNWAYWRNMPCVKLEYAVALSVGLDPFLLPQRDRGKVKVVFAMAFFSHRLSLAEAHARAGPLSGLVMSADGGEVSLPAFAAWTDSLDPPWELPEAFPRRLVDLPSEFPNKPLHPFYSHELDVAMQAWVALYGDMGVNLKFKRGHTQRIRDWLVEHYPGLSNKARERIVVLVNPNKMGGAPAS